MYTLNLSNPAENSLPSYGRVYGYVTVTAVNLFNTDMQHYGYVNDIGDTEIEEYRNDVLPLVSADLNDEDLADYVREAIENLGASINNGDGTWYGEDSKLGGNYDYTLVGDYDYTYALHFLVKHRNANATNVFNSYSETPLNVIL